MGLHLWAVIATGLAVLLLVPPGSGSRLQSTSPPDGPLSPDRTASVPGALPSKKRIVTGLAPALAAAALTASWGWWAVPVSVVAGVSCYLALGRIAPAAAHRRRAQLVRDLPGVCALLAVCVESGQPLRNATATVARCLEGPMEDVLAGVSRRVQLGIAEGQAWREVGDEPGFETVARELVRAADSGIALAPLLRGQAVEMRAVARSEAEVRARRVGVRSVLPLMVCYFPAFFLLGVVPVVGGVLGRLFG